MADPITDAAAAEGIGSLFGAGDFLGLGSLFGAGDAAAGAGAGAADALGAGAATAGDYAFNPGFSSGVFDYLGGDAAASAIPAADAASGLGTAGDTAGFGNSATSTAGSSAFDPGSYASGAASTPDWLNGGALFDTSAAGALPGGETPFSGVGSGVSSFGDTMAAGGSGPVASTGLQGGGDFAAGGPSAFTPGSGIQVPDPSSIDPTSLAATGDVTTPANATPTAGTLPQNSPIQPGPQVTDASGTVNAPGLTTEMTGGSGPVAGPGNALTPAATNTANAASSGGKFLGMDIGKPTLLGGAGLALSGGLLATNLLRNNVPGQDQVNSINSNIPQIQSVVDSANKQAAAIQASTGPLTADAQAMMSYVSQGTLPPAMQAQVANGVQAAKSQAASIMAQHGLSADPTRNAQLKQQFDTIDSQALQLQGTLATQLYQSGLQAQQTVNQTNQTANQMQTTALSALGLNQTTYLALQKIYSDQDAKTQAAVTNFATALGKMGTGSSGSGTTIKIGGT